MPPTKWRTGTSRLAIFENLEYLFLILRNKGGEVPILKKTIWITCIATAVFYAGCYVYDNIAAKCLSEHLFDYVGPGGSYNLNDPRVMKCLNAINSTRTAIYEKDGGRKLGRYNKKTFSYLNGEKHFGVSWNEQVDAVSHGKPVWFKFFLGGACGDALVFSDNIILGPGTFNGEDVCGSTRSTVAHEIMHLSIGVGHDKIPKLIEYYFPH